MKFAQISGAAARFTWVTPSNKSQEIQKLRQHAVEKNL